MKFVFIT